MDVKDLELLRKIINQLYSLEDRTQEDVDSFIGLQIIILFQI